MFAYYALLVPAAFVVLYIALFAVGAVVGAVSLAVQALRAVVRTRSVKTTVAAPQPLVQPSRPTKDFVIRSFHAPATA